MCNDIFNKLKNGVSGVLSSFKAIFLPGMEMVGPSKRMWAGIVVEYFFALGMIILAGVGYMLRDWRHINMAVTFPNLVFLSYFWFEILFIYVIYLLYLCFVSFEVIFLVDNTGFIV